MEIFDIVFLLVVVYTLVQGPTLPRAARLTGVAEDLTSHEVAIETAPLDEIGADLMEVTVPADSRLPGVWLADLRLPAGGEVVLVVRDGRPAVPNSHTVIHGEDRLLIVTTRQARPATEARLRAVGRSGRLAGWLETKGAAP
jgi:cell volume regulation protein A